ncbi:MAG: hypothetical protein HDR00_01550 [Lachnospiraceae bacterium]|nr:hypothetical protein [Lachnospiraceae bacterium]
MKFGELEAGTEIDIEVKMQQNKWTFHSVIRQMVKGVALMEGLMNDGKILDLSGEGVAISVVVKPQEGEIPMQFRGCVAKNIRTKEGIWLALNCPNPGKRINRRNAFRVFVGEKGNVSLTGKSKSISVTVKDMSILGFSFVTNTSEWDDETTRVVLSFTGRYGEEMRMQGIVVRSEQLEREMVVVGCKIGNCANNLADYVSFMQRDNLRKSAGKRD